MVLDRGLAAEGVLEEAEFYNVAELVRLLQQRLAAQLSNSVPGQRKHVYRVLQCHEDELTQMVSTMSDGWKFEQLVNIGSQYTYGSEEHAEFLCVVSREYDATQGSCPEPSDRAKVLQQKGSRM